VGGAHPHLIVNHLPVFATGIGVVLLVFAWRRREQAGRLQAALFVLVLAGLSSAAAFLTGIPAEEAVEGLPGVEEHMIHAHHAPALAALVVSLVIAALAVVAYVRSRRPGAALSRVWFAWLGLAGLVALVLLGWASNLGGLIRHTEIR
jgi:multisubunit Na+/H+ antiporter MnhB subunit